jgi:energy-coupling factor transport system ATP-binding protein
MSGDRGQASVTHPASLRAAGWGWRHAGRVAWAVRELDLNVQAGERILLLGASGSGKSTLLSGISGVLGGDDDGEAEGSLTLDGVDPARARGRAGLLLQDPESQTVLARVGDDVAFACENIGVPREQIWPRVEHALAQVGLNVGLRHPTAALSGGQKQRLALAGLLAMQPGILLLDEPTANLDPAGVAEVRDAVARVAQNTGATLVVVEHRIDGWIDLVDRVVVLGESGGVLADGVPAEVFRQRSAELAAAGVWLPSAAASWPSEGGGSGTRNRTVAAATEKTGESELVRTQGLAVGRPRGPKIPVRDLGIEAGSTTALVGPNGAGKSTVALTLGGLLPPVRGRVTASALLRGSLAESPIQWRSAALVSRVGSVFQNPEHQFVAPTVRDELAIGPRAVGMPARERDAVIDEAMERLRLDALAKANPFTLSGGQKRRLSVATALVTKPRMLVLDEPTFGQDAVTWRELVALLAEVRDAGSALVIATHDADVLRELGARRYELSDARSMAGAS